MKNIVLIVALLAFSFGNAQAFKGKGDSKFQVGANLQDGASGINVSYDYGLGENISIGLSSSYALGIDGDIDVGFDDRFDIKARFNANLGNVINIDENFDFYPGLSLGLKNFGGHVGARYFFSEGFGLYAEASFPLAKYSNDKSDVGYYIHNQFAVNVGAVFNL